MTKEGKGEGQKRRPFSFALDAHNAQDAPSASLGTEKARSGTKGNGKSNGSRRDTSATFGEKRDERRRQPQVKGEEAGHRPFANGAKDGPPGKSEAN